MTSGAQVSPQRRGGGAPDPAVATPAWPYEQAGAAATQSRFNKRVLDCITSLLRVKPFRGFRQKREERLAGRMGKEGTPSGTPIVITGNVIFSDGDW